MDAEYRDERCSSSGDGDSGCRIVSQLSIPLILLSLPPLDISTYISTGDAMPFVISLFLDFIIFSMKIREDFENRD